MNIKEIFEKCAQTFIETEDEFFGIDGIFELQVVNTNSIYDDVVKKTTLSIGINPNNDGTFSMEEKHITREIYHGNKVIYKKQRKV